MKYRLLRRFVRAKQHPFTQFWKAYFAAFFVKASATNSQVKLNVLQFLPFLLASIITGFLAFLYSQAFHYSELLSITIYEQEPLTIFLLCPICFLISWWLVFRYAPFSKGSGIPQVMAAIELSHPSTSHLVPHYLSLKIIFIKFLSSTVKVLGGGIIGREGPTIQISSSIFLFVHRMLPKWWVPISQKNFIIAGAASGLAAAFNTPLGGIIFAIEELSRYHIKYYKSPLFIAVIISGLTAQGLGGSYLYLGYPKGDFNGWLVIVGFVIVSIFSGFLGSKMCVWLMSMMEYFNSFKKLWKQALIVTCCGLVVATLVYFVGIEALGSGKIIMDRTLFTSNKAVEWYLPVVRMVGQATSFAFGGAGGVFAPSLSSGASLGAYVAHSLGLVAGNADLLILIGMTGFLTAVTRAPFTSAIIIFEMTDRHSIIFFLLIGALLSNVVATIVAKHSFYDILKENYLRDGHKMNSRV